MDPERLQHIWYIAFNQTRNTDDPEDASRLVGILMDLGVGLPETVQAEAVLRHANETFFSIVRSPSSFLLSSRCRALASELGLDRTLFLELMKAARNAYREIHFGSDRGRRRHPARTVDPAPTVPDDDVRDPEPAPSVPSVSQGDVVRSVGGIVYRLSGDTLRVTGRGTVHDVPLEFKPVTRHVILDQGIREIGIAAFSGWNMVSVHLPDTLVKIRKHAFEHCFDLVDMNCPSSLRCISWYALDGTRVSRGRFPFRVWVRE